MFSKALLVAAAFMAAVNAQTISTSSASSVAASSTVSQVMPPAATAGFNPNNVSSSDKFNWCLAQINTCPQICGGAASVNRCDGPTLTYTCICPNGTVPDSSAYQQTLPFYICQATYGQCIANNPNNAEAQGACKDNQQCGTRNATAEAIAATSGSGSSTASSTSGSGSATGSASGSGASATASGSVASINTITTSALAAVLMAAFKLFL